MLTAAKAAPKLTVPKPGAARVVAFTANKREMADYESKGFIIGPWSTKNQGYEVQRAPAGVGRKAKVPLAEHDAIRAQLKKYRRLRALAREISPAALAKKHNVSQAVIERIEACIPYKNIPANEPDSMIEQESNAEGFAAVENSYG
jgi:hypothetical protein